MSDLDVTTSGHIAVFRINRPPTNYFDKTLITAIADAGAEADDDANIRAIVLCSEGKHFCAGANFGEGKIGSERAESSRQLYREATRVFDIKTPIVAAVQGAAVGGGLGLACAADFRVTNAGSRFHANFATLGFHQGFALSVTLPRIIGLQAATDLLYTGRAVKGEEAVQIGLADRLVDDPFDGAMELADRIAHNAPLAVRSIRATMRAGLVDEIRQIVEHELTEQSWLWDTEDCKEGIRANLERREAHFRSV